MYDCTVRLYLYSQQEESRFFQKAVLRIFKIALRLRGWHVFMRQSLEIFNVLDTLTLKYFFFEKRKLGNFKKIGVPFVVESTMIESATFS